MLSATKLESIKKHLDRYGNTIINEKHFKNTTRQEITEALEKEGYSIEWVYTKQIDENKVRKPNYWMIKGKKVM